MHVKISNSIHEKGNINRQTCDQVAVPVDDINLILGGAELLRYLPGIHARLKHKERRADMRDDVLRKHTLGGDDEVLVLD